MIATEVIALAAVGNGSHQDRFVGTEIVTRIGLWQLLMNIARNWYEIEYRGGEMPDLATLLMGDIPGHGQRF